jgi:Acetyltransferase (GNAT) domain
MAKGAGVRLEPWGKDDLPLVRRLMGDPAMTEHLGGPESEVKLVERQARYERVEDEGTGRMFRIVDEATGDAAGSVGFWAKDWRDQQVYEIGWSVLPEFQAGASRQRPPPRQSRPPGPRAGTATSTRSLRSTTGPRTASAASSASSSSATSSSSTRRATSCAATTGASISSSA